MFLNTFKEREVLRNWRKRYKEISSSLPLSFERDQASSELAFKIFVGIGARVLDKVFEAKRKIWGREVDVVGAYDSAEEYSPSGRPLIGVDGGAAALIEKGIIPEIIVTDLDGPVETLSKANSIFFVHFHGDNIDKALKCPSEILSRGIPTVQTFPYGPCLNFGGFTDGDRAVYMAAMLGASRIHLFAFNFEKIGKYSYSRDPKIKLEKLRWARTMLEDLEKMFGELIIWERENTGNCLGR